MTTKAKRARIRLGDRVTMEKQILTAAPPMLRSPAKERTTAQLATIFNLPTDDPDQWASAFGSLSQITPSEAIEAIARFPNFIYPVDTKADEDTVRAASISKFQTWGVVMWLWAWNTGKSPFSYCHFPIGDTTMADARLPIPFDKEVWVQVDTTFLLGLEPIAVVARLRRQLIEAIAIRRGWSERYSSAFLWLLAEASLCRRNIQGTLGQRHSKREYYEKTKAYLDWLDDIETYGEKSNWSIPDFILKIDEAFEFFGKEHARRESQFDEDYWKPYIRAKKRLNSLVQKGKYKLAYTETRPTRKRGGRNVKNC